MLKKKKSYLIPIIGFALIIIVGSILLDLPVTNRREITYKDALYTAISSLSCTGLIKFTTVEQFNIWGQLVIAILMEIGALGFLIFIAYIWSILGRKLKISDIIMINDNISGDNFSAIKKYSIFIFNLMIKVQAVGVVLLSLKFVPQYGFFKGVWYSIFHTISSFANAGFDLMPSNGFFNFKNDSYIQIVLIILMFLGSIGIFVIEDMKEHKFRNFKKLKLQTKIVLVSSVIIIAIPTILLKIFEPEMSLLNCLFMSTSCRSTGFAITNLSECNNVSKILLTILMFIGGSPASTAGGIRIVGFSIIIATIISTLRGRDYTVMFWKKIPDFTVKKAFTIFMLFLLLLSVTTIIFSYNNNNINLINILFESVSAVTNTGLTITDINTVDISAEIILMFLMYVGRVGPLTMILAFVNEDEKNRLIEYPSEDVVL